MFDFQKCTKLRLMLMLSLQDLLQSLNLEKDPIDNVEPHCPHDNIGGDHLWNECRKLIVPIVCHMLESILWQIVPVCWLTTECQVDQFVPGTSTLKEYGCKLLTIHIYFPCLLFLIWWSSKHGWETLYNTVPRTFEHVLPCRGTTLKFLREVCPVLDIFRLLQQKYGIQTFCCIVQWFGRLVCIPVECIRNDVGSSISTSFINFFHKGAKFCFCPAILMSSTQTDKNNFCFYERITIPNLILFPNQVPSMLFRTVLPTRVLRVGVRKSFVQEEKQDHLSSHDFGHLCFGRRIHTSGHSDLGILSGFWASSVFTRCTPILRQLLVRHNRVVEQ